MKVVEVKQIVRSVAAAAILALLSVCDTQALDDTGGSQVQLKRSSGWAAQIDQEAQEKERIEKEREQEAKRIAAEKALKDKKIAEEKAKKAAQEKEQNAKIAAEIARKKAEEAKEIAERKEWAQKEYGETMLSSCVNFRYAAEFFQGIKQANIALFSDPFIRIDRVGESPDGNERQIDYNCYIVAEQDISYFTAQELVKIMEKHNLYDWISNVATAEYLCNHNSDCLSTIHANNLMRLDPDDPKTHKPFTKKGQERTIFGGGKRLTLFKTINGTWKVRKSGY
ncbi:hypothetical protein FACS189487_01330 [Campylobacterota bacterium]|nr:hypothetical protein FACS189487_01330 [Campylobacterota bacterium]